MRWPKRKFAKLPSPHNKGRIGDLIVLVENKPQLSYVDDDGILVTGNFPLPPEISAAAKLWFRFIYAEMTLTEYLNKMFDAENYRKAIL